MLKFFKKVKKKLLNKNKFSKYLMYAIGEIILVVIGILIALSLNNWNESIKNTKLLNGIYSVVAEDLIKDNAKALSLSNFFKNNKVVFNRILNDSLKLNEIKRNEATTSILTDIRLLNINTRGYHLLRDFANNPFDNDDSLTFYIIDFYTESIYLSEKIESIILDDVMKTNDLWKNQDWYANVVNNKPDERFFEYMLSNKEFKNICAFRHDMYYQNYMPVLEHFNQGSVKILELLNARLDEK